MSALGRSNWLAWWQLLRVGNVFTAVSNVVAGAVLAGQGTSHVPSLTLACLTSICLYSAGMVFNDVFDAELDARERPERPIPSGRILRRHALTLGCVLVAIGLGAALLNSYFQSDYTPALIAGLLLLAVLAYDGVCKAGPLGPLVMGLCRFLNVLLGAGSTGLREPHDSLWVHATAIGVFTCGVTLIARGEVTDLFRRQLLAGCGLVVLAVAIEGLLPTVHDSVEVAFQLWTGIWAIAFLYCVATVSVAFKTPAPNQVRSIVGKLIFLFIPLDALATALAAGWVAGLAVLALFLPARLISLRVPPS